MVNWIAVLVAVIGNLALGMFWYSPFGFGKHWMRWRGGPPDKDMISPKAAISLAALVTLFYTGALALLVDFTAAETVLQGALVGFLLWFITAGTHLVNVIYENQHKGVWGLYAAYLLVVLTGSGMLLAAW